MVDPSEVEQYHRCAMEFADSVCEALNKSVIEAVSAISAIGEAIQNARPQTVEEWEEAYNALLADYRELYKAAENVTTIALSPGMCAPTSEDEDGSTRKIVATRALDELDDVLYG